MNLLLSDDQTQIVDCLRTFLADQAPLSRFRPPAPQVGNGDRRYWTPLSELGFLAISLSEEQGGIGLSAAEEMLAYREFGRYLLSPGVFGLSMGVLLAVAAGSSLRDDLLTGQVPVGLANPRGPAMLGGVCRGEFHLIEAQGAPWVLACDDGGAALLRRDDFSDCEPVLGTDNVVTLERATLYDVRPALWMEAAVGSITCRARLLLAAYAVGLAEATRDMAVAYAKVREQFGKPIGSFQSIKHICADMAIRSEAALCQVTFASLVLAEDQAGAEFHTVAGKLVGVDAALKNAAQNIQVHGAIGFTADADAHLYLKRAHLIDQLWGDTRQQRRRMLQASFPG